MGSDVLGFMEDTSSLPTPVPRRPQSGLDNPISLLQDRINRKLGRPVTSGDIVYSFTQGEKSLAGHLCYSATVCVHGVDDTLQFVGPQCATKREAKQLAAQMALACEALQPASVPQPEKEGLGSPRQRRSPVSELLERVQWTMRKEVTDRDLLTYSIEETRGGFIAAVEMATPHGWVKYSGQCVGKKRDAKRSAAEAALGDPSLQVSRASKNDDEVVSTRVDNSMGLLQARLQDALGRPAMRGDIVYRVEGDCRRRFVGHVTLHGLEQEPSYMGLPCKGKREAKHSAAACALLDTELEEIFARSTWARLASSVMEPGLVEERNAVSDLQLLVQKVSRKPSVLSDIVYTIAAVDEDFVATVQILSIEGCEGIVGEPCPSKRLAKRSAAEAALASSPLRVRLAEVSYPSQVRCPSLSPTPLDSTCQETLCWSSDEGDHQCVTEAVEEPVLPLTEPMPAVEARVNRARERVPLLPAITAAPIWELGPALKVKPVTFQDYITLPSQWFAKCGCSNFQEEFMQFLQFGCPETPPVSL